MGETMTSPNGGRGRVRYRYSLRRLNVFPVLGLPTFPTPSSPLAFAECCRSCDTGGRMRDTIARGGSVGGHLAACCRLLGVDSDGPGDDGEGERQSESKLFHQVFLFAQRIP